MPSEGGQLDDDDDSHRAKRVRHSDDDDSSHGAKRVRKGDGGFQ